MASAQQASFYSNSQVSTVPTRITNVAPETPFIRRNDHAESDRRPSGDGHSGDGHTRSNHGRGRGIGRGAALTARESLVDRVTHWAQEYTAASKAESTDTGLTQATPGLMQPDGVENPISTEMDVEDDGATNRLALALATPSSNVCLEEPLLWRSLPQTARTEWAKKQVLERIPDYMQLHNVQTSAGSTFLTAADVVGHYLGTKPSQNPLPQIMLLQSETLMATRVIMKAKVPGVYAVLNMASEKRPGGQLFMDSLQQEESLCMQSDLYHRLEKMSDHYPLRPGELIISNDVFVCFSNRHRALPRQECYNTNVISMAAPICNNDMTGVRYIGSAQATQMQANIKTLLGAADASGTNVLVLGAWGCGVYRNPAAGVAQLFHAELSTRDWSRSSLTHIIFAICDEAKGQPVWKPFRRRFDGCLPGFEPTVVDHMANFCNKIWYGSVGPQK
jgi:uncharacterized protein (TIGR02452 family)